jgi:hypothetical protein
MFENVINPYMHYSQQHPCYSFARLQMDCMFPAAYLRHVIDLSWRVNV